MVKGNPFYSPFPMPLGKMGSGEKNLPINTTQPGLLLSIIEKERDGNGVIFSRVRERPRSDTQKQGNKLVSSFVACDLFGVIVSRFAFLCSYISWFSQNLLETAVNIVGGIIEGDKERFLILKVALLGNL